MNGQRLWCAICNTIVEITIEEVASAVIPPLFGMTAGGALGAKKGGKGGALAGALLGLGIGALVRALVPPAQRRICTECGNHVA